MKRRFPLNFLLDTKGPSNSGRISGLSLSGEVRVDTDAFGIPRISAETDDDLHFGQGWVHASQRLWQMESIRRFAAGRLSEIGGDELLELDHFSRLAGFPEVCRRAIDGLSESSMKRIDAYISGVNAFIERAGDRLPLEFRSSGIRPEPWTVADVTANLAVNSWYLQTNFLEEVFAVRARKKLTREQWDVLLPGMKAFDGSSLPEDEYFEELRRAKIGAFIPATYAFYKEFKILAGASNNWVCADGPGGKPLLANDPHLGIQLPQIWFACGLQCPDFDVIGVGMPGFPGIIIGRTPTLAWGFTNVMTDIVDLFVVPVDFSNKTCRINGKTHPLEERKETYVISGERKETRSIWTTPHGPVLTELNPELDSAVCLKWYGTVPELDDDTVEGIFQFPKSKTIADLFGSAAKIRTLGQNIVAGDSEGNIGWQPTGAIPIRRGYSGRLPANGAKDHDWVSYVPFKDMPSSLNPVERFIVTANNRTVDPDAPVMATWSWAKPWRKNRIDQEIRAMGMVSHGAFMELQTDTKSLSPESLLPGLLNHQFRRSEAVILASILGDWNGEVLSGEAAPLIYNLLPKYMAEVLLRERLGNDLEVYLTLLPFYPSFFEYLVREPEALAVFGNGQNPAPGLGELVEEALVEIYREGNKRFGKNPKRWKWGNWHRMEYKHPGGKGKLAGWLLNRGPWSADGDWSTINVSGYSLVGGPGEVTTIPSMRFISSLDDANANSICLPLGQSGRPGNRHYDDFARRFRRGDYVPFPMHPDDKYARAGGRLMLNP